MSVAAPKLRPEPRHTGERARPAHRPAARPPHVPRSTPSQRARRRSSSAFWVLTAIVVTVLIVGIVSISALLVRASFRVETIRETLSALQAEHAELTIEAVTLSAPSRIADWARNRGMVRAGDVQVLRIGCGAAA